MDNYLEYKDIYDYSVWIAENFWRMWKNIFLAGEEGLDVDDLKQEAQIEVFTRIPKITNAKSKEDLKKIVIRHVVWRMLNLMRKEKPYLSTEGNERNYIKIIPFTDTEEGVDITRIIDPRTEKPDLGFKFEDIETLLTKREFEIICSVIRDKESYREIGKKLGISRTWVNKHYKDAIMKLRKYFKKEMK